MNKKLLFATLSCLFLFSSVAPAQQDAPPSKWKINVQFHKGPMIQGMVSDSLKRVMRRYWDGRNAEYILPALDTSDELKQQIQEAKKAISQAHTALVTGRTMEKPEDPEFQKLMEEKQVLVKKSEKLESDPEYQRELQKFWEEESKKAGQPLKIMFPDLYPNMPAAAKEGIKKNTDFSKKATDWMMKAQHDAVVKVLPPEVKKKINEVLLANMSELPIISPNMFEALDLIDAQKQQMEKIKKEHEGEFEKKLEKLVSGQWLIMNKVLDELDKQDGDENAFWEQFSAVHKKMLAEDTECKKLYEEVRTQGQSFATQYKVKTFDILTDEQWIRLLDLIDNPPEHALAFRKWLESEDEKRINYFTRTLDDEPWKTGEAIPLEYRQKRSR